MSFGQKIIDAIENRREYQRKNQQGAVGSYWRAGGNQLLYDMPVKTGGLIIDAGGYQGDWTAGMISRYGCKSIIYEPVPEYCDHCKTYFRNNTMVQVNKAALGGSNRTTVFNLLDNGTSEYKIGNNTQNIEAAVIDVAGIFEKTLNARIACFKLNIEGGEYEVLERMLETDNATHCDSLIIQFHRQPEGYEKRYKNIVDALRRTHTQSWCYEMVWEKWVCNVVPT
jgi:FkbM family methyltransferase